MDTINSPQNENPTQPSPPITSPEISLSEEQTFAVSQITSWVTDPLNTKKEFKLGGYAGTGKTTIIKHLLKNLPRQTKCRVSAFTGKACNVLGKKGVAAQTLHSLIYDVEHNTDGTVSFIKKYRLDGNPSLVIVDEASMVSCDLYDDLKSFNIKLLFVGDPGQLEPVGQNPNLMKQCDFVLSKIHRQAEKSPIITLANSIRTGGTLKHISNLEGGLVIKDKSLSADLATSHNQIICAKNATRTKLNERLRQFLSKSGHMTVGEKIMVLKNSRQFAVFNGLILTVQEILHEDGFSWLLNLEDEVGNKYRHLSVWKRPYTHPEEWFIKDKTKHPICPSKVIYTDYAYAITCHKSQGSEWDRVLVVDEWIPPALWDMARWRYTAITRAAKHLTYCV